MAQLSPDEFRKVYRSLRNLLRPGTTVYTVLRHVAKSRHLRRISCFVIIKGKERGEHVPLCIDSSIALLGIFDLEPDKDGLVVTGCERDMGFNLVYMLGRAMYPHGFVPTKKQRERFQWNGLGRDGGYALNHQWL